MGNYVDNKIICKKELFDTFIRTTILYDDKSEHVGISFKKFHEEFPEYDIGDHFEDVYYCTCEVLENGMIDVKFSTRNHVPIKFAVSLVQQFRSQIAYYFIEENEIYISRLLWIDGEVREEVFPLVNNLDYEKYWDENIDDSDGNHLVWKWGVVNKTGWILCKDRNIIKRYEHVRPESWEQPE